MVMVVIMVVMVARVIMVMVMFKGADYGGGCDGDDGCGGGGDDDNGKSLFLECGLWCLWWNTCRDLCFCRGIRGAEDRQRSAPPRTAAQTK